MAKVYNIFTKKPLKQTKDFYTRFEKCLKNKEEFGKCECDLCIEKRDIAYDVIDMAHKRCIAYNKKVENTLAWGDLLDICLTASRTVQDFLDTKELDGQDE